MPVVATGLAGGPTGARIRELLDADEVLHDFVEVAGDSRTNIAILDPTTGEQTEINERGPEVSAHELERFVDRLRYLAGGASFCVVAGSVPPGVPPETYAEMISELRGLDLPVLLDTDGEPMRAGLRAQPSVVAPNVAEAEEVVGHEFNDADDLWMGISGLVEMGAREAIITRAAGCVAEICDDSGLRRRCEVELEPLEGVATVGSGDAFLAGYVAARHRGDQAEDCLAYGVACGAESTLHMGAGILDPTAVEPLLDRVSVRPLTASVTASR